MVRVAPILALTKARTKRRYLNLIAVKRATRASAKSDATQRARRRKAGWRRRSVVAAP